MFSRKLNIGFSFNISNSGPANFLNTLRYEMNQRNDAKASLYLNPFTDCNIYSNRIRNIWRRPYIYRMDGVAYDLGTEAEKRKYANEMLIEGIRNAIGVVYQSDFARYQTETVLGIQAEVSVKIMNGVSLERFNPIGEDMRNELGVGDKTLLFISTAKWRPAKRLGDICESFNKYREESGIDARLLIIGEGSEQLIDRDAVICLPKVDNKLIPRYLRSADIFLYYSWLDTCPNSVVEAIACGLPVICTNQGGTREIVEATNGGVIVDVDEKIDINKVDLQRPPKPDINKMASAIDGMVNNLAHYKKKIDRSPIDIKMVCGRYIEFIRKAIGSS